MAKLIGLIVGFCLLMIIMRVECDLPRFEHKVRNYKGDDASISFLVVGDWGRNGTFNQSQVATQMGIIGEKLDVDFVISTGDNFYDDGLTGVDDPAFQHSFSDIYTAPSLQKQWYIDVADLFFVDTTPFHDKYFNDTKHTYDWRGVLPRNNYISNLLKDLDEALKKSKAKWKFVIGHHTIMSAGKHGNTEELVEKLLPIFKDNKVDFYINGHDHCVEHIINSDSGVHFMTSGGGSKAWGGEIKSWDPKELKLYYDGQGFMSMQVTQTEANVAFYDISSNVLHTWKSTKPQPADYTSV